jgi:four helix bundle protein
MSHGVRRLHSSAPGRTASPYKKAVYAICQKGPLATNLEKRTQPEDSVSGPPGHIAEGFGRFNPPDFARFVVIARSSLMESQNHLLDLVDKRYIDDATRGAQNALAEAAFQEIKGADGVLAVTGGAAKCTSRQGTADRVAIGATSWEIAIEPRTQH